MKNGSIDALRDELIEEAAQLFLKSDHYYQMKSTALISGEDLKKRDFDKFCIKLRADELTLSVKRGFQLIWAHIDEVLSDDELFFFHQDMSKINADSLLKRAKEARDMQKERRSMTYQAYFGLKDETLRGIYALGVRYYDKKEFQNANAVFSAMTTINPYSAQCWKALGFCSQNRLDDRKALNQFAMAYTIDPNDVEAHILCAECCLRLDMSARANNEIEVAFHLIKENQELEERWGAYLKSLQFKKKTL